MIVSAMHAPQNSLFRNSCRQKMLHLRKLSPRADQKSWPIKRPCSESKFSVKKPKYDDTGISEHNSGSNAQN